MREFFHRYKVLTLFIVGIFFISFLGTVGILWWSGNEAKSHVPPAGQAGGQQETQVVKQVEEPDTAIAADTQIIRRVVYLGCGDASLESSSASPSEVGLTAVEFAAKNPRWEINTFSKERVLITMEVSGLCPTHQDQSYLGVKDGYVAVYAGVPGLAKEIVRDVADTRVESLPQELQRQLTQGMEFTYFLGIKDNRVAIYFGNHLKKDLIFYKVTEYKTSDLPDEEVADLKKFIEVKSERELQNILESYSEMTGTFE